MESIDFSKMSTMKTWLVDSDTVDKMHHLEGLAKETLDDAACSLPSYSVDALKRVHGHGGISATPRAADASQGMCSVPVDVFEDLEVFEAYRSSTEPSSASATTVAEAIDKTRLAGSKHYLHALLRKPIAGYDCLLKRQLALERLKEKYAENRERTDAMLSGMLTLERDVLWMFRSMDEEMDALHEIAYFRAWFMSTLNGSAPCLTALNLYKIVGSPLIGILSPLMYFIIPYAVLRLRFNVRLPFRTYIFLMWKSFTSPQSILSSPGSSSTQGWIKLISCGFSMLFYFQSLFSSFEVSSTLRKICGMLVSRMRRVQAFLSKAQALLQLYWDDESIASWFACAPCGDTLAPARCDDGTAAAESDNAFSLFSNFGVHLKAFHQFDHRANGKLLSKVYVVDCLLSIIRLRECPGFCRADVLPTKNAFPKLSVRGGWHPCIPFESNVKNSYVMGGGGSAPPGMMLTGPNAGGKSTLLKSMMISALMAQSLLTAPAASIQLTPFLYLNSHVNVPDCKGRTSLFEAEMNRAKANLDALKRLAASEHPERFAFIIMDEIFSSTNPVEGIAGGYAVAKNIASTGTCICAISTHFTYLSKLAKKTGLYSNWQMPVAMAQDRFEYPYKLRKGVCRQYIALELLKRTQFGDAIVKDAIEIKKQMTSPSSSSAKKEKKTDGTREQRDDASQVNETDAAALQH